MADLITTMRPDFDGTANTAALKADVAQAAGGEVFIPAGTYLIDYTNFVTNTVLNLRGEQGTIISPDGVIANDGTIQAIIATNNCTVTIKNLTIDGLLQCDGAIKCVGGTFVGSDISIRNIGRVATNTFGTISLGFSGCTSVVLHGYKSRFVQCAPNGVYSDQNGLARHLWLFNVDSYDISYLDLFDGEGDDYDAIHIQDLRTPVVSTGTIKHAKVTVSENLRRVAKFQGGNHVLDGLYAPQKAGFVPYQAGSDTGKRCLNAIDWAGNQDGSLTLKNSSIDARAFPTAFAKTIAGPASMTIDNTTLYGTTKPVNNPLAAPNNAAIGIWWDGTAGGTLTKTNYRGFNFANPEFDVS